MFWAHALMATEAPSVLAAAERQKLEAFLGRMFRGLLADARAKRGVEMARKTKLKVERMGD